LSEEAPPHAVYELETVVVEEYAERTVSSRAEQIQVQVTPTGLTVLTARAGEQIQAREEAWEVSDQEVEDLVTLVRGLRGVGYSVASEYPDLESLRSQVRHSRELYNSILEQCRSAAISLVALTMGMVEYWYRWLEARGKAGDVETNIYRDYLEILNELLARTLSATSARDLVYVLDRALPFYRFYKPRQIDVKAVASDLKRAIDEQLSIVADEDIRKQYEMYKRALDLLADRDRLKDVLARFFVLMDLVREETYRLFVDSYFDNSRALWALIRIIHDDATYDDFIAGLGAVIILLELESKGALNIKKLIPMAYKHRYKIKLRAIESGVLPGREPVGIVQLAETLAQINPFRHLYDLVYNSLKGVFGEQVAKVFAVAVTGAAAGALFKISLPLGVALGALAIISTIADIGSRLANPIDREIFANFIKEHWQEILVYMAISVAASIAVGYAVQKLKVPVTMKVASIVERVSPTLAEKIRSLVAPRAIVGKVIYRERDVVEVYLTDDDTLVVVDRSRGTAEVVLSYKVTKNVRVMLEDPELGVRVGTMLAKHGRVVKSVALVGDDLVFKGDRMVAIFSPSTKGTIVIDSSSPLLEAVVKSPEAFKMYYIAAKLGLTRDDLLNPTLNYYLSLFREQGSAFGRVNIKGLVFEFRGDKLYIVSGVKDIATIDLRNFDGAMLMKLITAGEKFLKTYGQQYYHLALDTIALGYGLLSPQVINLEFMSNYFTTPIVNLNDVMPRVKNAIGVTQYSNNYQVFLSHQVLADDTAVRSLLIRLIDEKAVKEAIRSSLAKIGFREVNVSIVKLSPKTAAYIKQAEAAGLSGLDALYVATGLARNAGDIVSAQVLAQLLVNLKLSETGLITLHVAASSNTGAIFGFAATSAALTGVSQQVAEMVARGDYSGARQTLVNALVATGLQQQTARQLAEEILRQFTAVRGIGQTVVVRVVVPVRATREVYVPRREYETATVHVDAVTIGRVIRVPVEIGAIYVPRREYETATVHVDAVTIGRVIRVPVEVVVEETGEVYVPRREYERAEQYSDETARDTAVVLPVEVVVPTTRDVYVPTFRYEATESYSSEAMRDTAVRVPVEVVVEETGEVYAPRREYESSEQYSAETARDRAVRVPVEVVVEETGEVYAPRREYERAEQYSRDTARDVVVKVPVIVTVPEERTETLTAVVHDDEERGVNETRKGVITYVVKPVDVAVVVTIPVDVEEGRVQPQPTPPLQATGATPSPQALPAGAVERAAERRRPEERRGVGELELLVY
jgi:hypothetical protein